MKRRFMVAVAILAWQRPFHRMTGKAIFAVAGLWAAVAAAHPADECRTTPANCAEHAEVFEENRKFTGPAFEALYAAWDKVEEADGHAGPYAVIFRHFVADFPRLLSHLRAEAETSAALVLWTRRAIFCLRRNVDGSP